MKVLLDTHTLIWWSDEPERLSQVALGVLSDTQNSLFVSVASIWEMQVKINLGKLKLGLSIPEMLRSQREINGLQLLPIELSHVYELSNLPHHHRDPFDRLLIAQSRIEEMPILTADAVFSSYDVFVLN